MNAQTPRIWPLGIRLQLTLWYTSIFAALLLVSGALFYVHLEYSLEENMDTTLELRAQAFAQGISLVNGTITIKNVMGVLPGFDASPSNQYVMPVDADNAELVRLLDAHGHLVRQTPNFRALQLPSESVTQPLHGRTWHGLISIRDGQSVRLISLPLSKNGQRFAVIQVGESLAELHKMLHELVKELLVVGLVVLLASAFGSFWLAARAFAPIRRLAVTARRIKAGDLHRRVPLPQAHDEVQYLALTLNEMLDSLEQAFNSQRRFVSDASHELRTPIAVIRNKIEVARLWAKTPEDYLTVLEGVNAEAERLGHLISDLLALARGDEGRTQFERELVRLDLIAGEVVASAQSLAVESGIMFEVRASEPVTILGDEARLIHTIMNLVDNAIRYTDPGGRVTVAVEEWRDQAYIYVRDTGIGIAPEHLPHIFERFYRADPARQSNGSGLGLSIVEWFVRAHGGTISVESQVGRGSSFTITLPLTSHEEEQLCLPGSVKG